MALNRYVVTADVTVPPGSPTAVSGGAGSTVSWSGPGPFPVAYAHGQVIVLDPAGPLYAAIGAPNLRAWADAAGRPGISN